MLHASLPARTDVLLHVVVVALTMFGVSKTCEAGFALGVVSLQAAQHHEEGTELANAL